MKTFKLIKKSVTLALAVGSVCSVFSFAKPVFAKAEKSGTQTTQTHGEESSFDSIKDITKPYLGVYEAKEIYFNGKDKSKDYKNLTVELTANNEFILRYRDKKGKTAVKKCKYVYDDATGAIRLKEARGLLGAKNKISLEKGEMNVFVRFGKRNLKLKLVQKG
jgi:hypothetical protein